MSLSWVKWTQTNGELIRHDRLNKRIPSMAYYGREQQNKDVQGINKHLLTLPERLLSKLLIVSHFTGLVFRPWWIHAHSGVLEWASMRAKWLFSYFEVWGQTAPDVNLRDTEAGVGWASRNKASIIVLSPHRPAAAPRNTDWMSSVVLAWYHSLAVRPYQARCGQWAHCWPLALVLPMSLLPRASHGVSGQLDPQRCPFLTEEASWKFPKLPSWCQ